jgi:Na+/glutamate symporter
MTTGIDAMMSPAGVGASGAVANNSMATAGLVSAGIGGVTDLITYFVNRADMQKAQKEAKAIDERNWAAMQEQNKFSESMQKQNLALNKNQVAFGQRQTIASNVTGITGDLINKLTNTLNNNEALKNTVIGRWAA